MRKVKIGRGFSFVCDDPEKEVTGKRSKPKFLRYDVEAPSEADELHLTMAHRIMKLEDRILDLKARLET